MTNSICAGSFETELAKRLSLLVKDVDEVTEIDVVHCYRAVAASLGLFTSPADDLHAQDIYATVAELAIQNRDTNLKVIERKIFDAIYMH
ncbi:hypothetical protein [Pseudomonas laurylsulfatiphila]|uniref:hypothetical protein n=1 Tax=Pseudomonas laurylsulfatiphila TaxID=2011015 RepID=UPI003D21CC32